MEEKVRRLRRKNAELAVLAKRLEERARKLQEANLKVVSSPSLIRLGSVEHYKRAFARQRACDLAHHALVLLSKDKEIASLQQECRALKPCLGIIEVYRKALIITLVLIVSVKESELNKKRKECENLEHEVKKRQKRCLDLEADLLRRKAQLLDQVSVGSFLPSQVTVGSFTHLIHISAAICQTRAKNEELREELSEVTAQHISVLEENKKLCAKLENLDQVLKHMREVAERRQQLELEHEQALAILKFKQDEIKRLQRAQLFAKREHEGVVQMLEVSDSTSKVRELEEKCRSQSEQFGLLSQELENFRLQASKVDLATSGLLNNPNLSGSVSKPSRRSAPCPLDSGVDYVLTPQFVTYELCFFFNLFHTVDTASEVEELDIDIASAPYTVSRGAAKLQVFIARYSYNPYDGPNDNPEVELPLTAGEYIYVYGDMDDDGFYEGTPDAPLDVQLERGPSPGIALVSWLPVTIDAAGTSNGVRVTGYTIYADKKKVLEVSSPTAGSVLLGPSQIHSLQAAQALTVRTTSVHSESCDSLSVNVPSKLAAIMSGSAIGAPAVPALTCTPMSPSLVLSKRSSGNSAAKVSVLPSDTQITGLTVEAAANLPHGLHSENPSSASYLNAWANPSCAAAAFSTSPVVPAITPVVRPMFLSFFNNKQKSVFTL
uniref:RIMS-binding protein 2-like n=1 Tax=Gouania willdenowi TaxID=441366 RepID=A0A8C5NBW0_GOUWI